MYKNIKRAMALTFSIIFLALSGILIGLAVYQFFQVILSEEGEKLTAAIIKSINTTIISLAIFELGVGVGKEYVMADGEDNIYLNIRRTVTRFVGTVCIALVLEALIMIIKYSQLDLLERNPYYPVSIILGASTLLIALGLFLKLSKGQKE